MNNFVATSSLATSALYAGFSRPCPTCLVRHALEPAEVVEGAHPRGERQFGCRIERERAFALIEECPPVKAAVGRSGGVGERNVRVGERRITRQGGARLALRTLSPLDRSRCRRRNGR